jgi:hypothetical protein
MTEAEEMQEDSQPSGVLRGELGGFAAIITFGGANAANNL